jgi:hypothetical protein
MPLHHSVQANNNTSTEAVAQPGLEVNGSVYTDPSDNYSEYYFPWSLYISFSFFGLLGFPIGLLLAFLMQMAMLGFNFLVLSVGFGGDVREDFMDDEDDDMQYDGTISVLFQKRFKIVLLCSLIIHALMILLLYLLHKLLLQGVVSLPSSSFGECIATDAKTTREQQHSHQHNPCHFFCSTSTNCNAFDEPHTSQPSTDVPITIPPATTTTTVHCPAPTKAASTPMPQQQQQQQPAKIIEIFVLQGLLIGLWISWMAADPTVWGVAVSSLPVAAMMMLMVLKRAA